MKPNRLIRLGFESALLIQWITLWASGDALVVLSNQSIRLGDTNGPAAYSYDSMNVQPGGKIELISDVTFQVTGDVQVDGEIFAKFEGKALPGKPGLDGDPGIDDEPNGLTGGTGGVRGDMGFSWRTGGPELVISSGGTVTINGAIHLNPNLEGGEGGKGGDGGDGGRGASPLLGSNFGGPGGGGSQGGQGGLGGGPGLPATLRISANQIVLTANGEISLDNLSAGGSGGEGGKGGDGARGGDGREVKPGAGPADGGHGGSGGQSGPGGNGAFGGAGGTLTLFARSVDLAGTISLRGGPGGNGGDAGEPGNGADGGNATGPTGDRGGDGGIAGDDQDYGDRGGTGGLGGPGGSLYVNANIFKDSSFKIFDGGTGGHGGAGYPAGQAKGGQGGAPDGADGVDSSVIPAGPDGIVGAAGKVYLNIASAPPNSRFVSAFPYWGTDGSGYLTQTSSTNGSAILELAALGTPFALSVSVNTDADAPFTLAFDYRWETGVGSLDVLLAGQNIFHSDAPAVVTGNFAHASVLISDPSLHHLGARDLVIRLTANSASRIQLGGIAFQTATNLLTVSRSPNQPGELMFTWSGLTGKTYQLQFRDSLNFGDWTSLGAPLQGNGAILTVSDPIAATQREKYYRLSELAN